MCVHYCVHAYLIYYILLIKKKENLTDLQKVLSDQALSFCQVVVPTWSDLVGLVYDSAFAYYIVVDKQQGDKLMATTVIAAQPGYSLVIFDPPTFFEDSFERAHLIFAPIIAWAIEHEEGNDVAFGTYPHALECFPILVDSHWHAMSKLPLIILQPDGRVNWIGEQRFSGIDELLAMLTAQRQEQARKIAEEAVKRTGTLEEFFSKVE